MSAEQVPPATERQAPFTQVHVPSPSPTQAADRPFAYLAAGILRLKLREDPGDDPFLAARRH
jgi:hypothetical protein